MTVNDPQIIVNVNDVNVIVLGVPGDFHVHSENADIVSAVKANMEKVKETPLIPGMNWVLFPTGKSTFIEMVASVVAVDPGTAIVVEAPEVVLDELREKAGVKTPGAIY